MESEKRRRSGAGRGRGRAWDNVSATTDDRQLVSAASSPALRFPAERFRERTSRFGAHPRSCGQVPSHQIQRRPSTVDECHEHSAHCAIRKTTYVADSAHDGAAWFQYQHDPRRNAPLISRYPGRLAFARFAQSQFVAWVGAQHSRSLTCFLGLAYLLKPLWFMNSQIRPIQV